MVNHLKRVPSNACRTQLMNIHTGQWDEKLSEIFGVDLNSLPQIVDSNAHFGDTDLFGLLPHPIPILSVLGDSQAALYAMDVLTLGISKLLLEQALQSCLILVINYLKISIIS